MNKSTHLVGTGIAVFVGSVLAVAPVAVTALAVEAPARVCLEDTSIGECEALGGSASGSGGTGSRVAVQQLPTVHIDAKDHPNYGQVTAEYRGDVKDHPYFGQITREYRGDVKDHPNYGQITPDADSDSGNVGLGGGRASGRSYAV